MVLPAQRIILSNVLPIIPNSQIENIFKKNNIKLLSNITPLKAGITDPDLSHILTFRKQVLDPEDAKRIPNSFKITIENNTYRIFTITGKQTCFTCQQEEHIANQCPNTEKPKQIQLADPHTQNPNLTYTIRNHRPYTWNRKANRYKH